MLYISSLICSGNGSPRRAGPALESLERLCERFVSGFQAHENKKGTYTIACPHNGAEKTVYGGITLEI